MIIIIVYKPHGLFSVDSTVQFYQVLTKKYTDWHPVIMAFIWLKLYQVFNTGNILYYFHLGLFTLGILLITAFLKKKKDKILSIIFIFLVTYLSLKKDFLIYIWKDTGMFCAYLLILGISLWVPLLSSKKLKICAVFIEFFLIFYAIAIRMNALFSGIVMTTLILFSYNRKLLKSLILGIIAVLTMLLIVNKITYDYLGAKKLYPIKYIMISDIYQLNYKSNKSLPDFLHGSGYNENKEKKEYKYQPNINKYIRGEKPLIKMLGYSILNIPIEKDIKNISKENLIKYSKRYDELNDKEIQSNYILIKKYWLKKIYENPILFLKIKVIFFIKLIGSRLSCLIFINFILQYFYSIRKKNIQQLLIYLSSCFYLWPYFIFNASYDYRYITYCILIEIFIFIYVVYTNFGSIYKKLKKWMDEK